MNKIISATKKEYHEALEALCAFTAEAVRTQNFDTKKHAELQADCEKIEKVLKFLTATYR